MEESTRKRPSREKTTTKKKSRHGGGGGNFIRDVCAVIRMRVGDSAIANALSACYDARVHTIFVVDPCRGEEDYAGQPIVRKMKGEGFNIVHLVDEGPDGEKLYSYMLDYKLLLEVPPDFRCIKEQTWNLISRARKEWRKYKQFAIAPIYIHKGAHLVGGLLLMLHVFWSLMSILTGGRLYRSTYMTLTVLTRELNTVTLPRTQFMHRERAPFVYASNGAFSLPPENRRGMEQFLYLARREPFSLRLWIAFVAYNFVMAFPVWAMRNYQVVLTMLMRDGFRLFVWILHAFIAFFYYQKYYAALPLGPLHILMMPLLPLLLGTAVIFAKVFWRGYGGEAPRLELPPLLIDRFFPVTTTPAQITIPSSPPPSTPSSQGKDDLQLGIDGNVGDDESSSSSSSASPSPRDATAADNEEEK